MICSLSTAMWALLLDALEDRPPIDDLAASARLLSCRRVLRLDHCRRTEVGPASRKPIVRRMATSGRISDQRTILRFAHLASPSADAGAVGRTPLGARVCEHRWIYGCGPTQSSGHGRSGRARARNCGFR